MEKNHPHYILRPGRPPVLSDSRGSISDNLQNGGVRSRGADLPPPLLTVQDLALLLATSSAGVYSRVARGQVPGVLRIGRTIRFDPRVIAQWLSANKASAGGHP